MEQTIKKGNYTALLRQGAYDVFYKDKYVFTITAKSAMLLVSSEILNEISKQFKIKL